MLIGYSAVVIKDSVVHTYVCSIVYISTCVHPYAGHGALFVFPVLLFCSDQFHVFEICRPLARYDHMWTVDVYILFVKYVYK